MELPSVPKGWECSALKWGTSSRQHDPYLMRECQRSQSFSSHKAVERLQGFAASLSISRPALERTQSQLHLDMTRLEEEFRRLLIAHSNSVDPDWISEQVMGPMNDEEYDSFQGYHNGSDAHEEEDGDVSVMQAIPDFDISIELLPLDVVSDLNDIAKCMMTGGYSKECCQVYISVRKAILEYSLSGLGMEKLGMDSVQKMPWEILEVRIMKWNLALKVAVQLLYKSEKLLCHQVFAGLSQLAESSFWDLSKGSVMQLLGFAEAIAISRRSPEKLFKILDMYETLSELLPVIDDIFSDELCMGIRKESKRTVLRLGEAGRGIFAEFENAIQRESSKIPVPGGAIHPLTRYVMNYIWLLFCYVGPLNRLLGDKKKEPPEVVGLENHASTLYFYEGDGKSRADQLSPLGVQIVWLMVLLECNLDGKSKLYKEIALTYLFLMNNVHYIVQKVKKCELASLVGKEWVEKQSSQVRQHATNYLRLSWKKLLNFLQEEGLHVSGTFFRGVSKSMLKDRLKCFNSLFEELHRTQSSWSVPDPELREELRISIEEKVIPAYRSFLIRHQSSLNSGRGRQKYIKYSPEDLERCLRDLFEGTPFLGGTRRMSFSAS
ncbi:hypothetical protein GOP47_0020231 [Adiantum capillus-veneris]|uniref:Exocyst subunit Exo70 family protein n=1 Tax=Adiantum capillus-veneris TaxID=13818 RepID=A0A9D4UE52_ADICA|nr:hypothetical protein GOP47_0020231 [Adiantum capillus-veneris]